MAALLWIASALGQTSTITIATPSLPPAVLGVGYLQILAAAGGTPPYIWSVTSGSLPPGLTLNPLGGAIGGTPTAAGAYAFTLQVADLSGANSTRQYTLTVVAAALALATASPLPDAVVGAPFTYTLAAAGGAPPYTWSVVSGVFPPGLTLDPANGALYGAVSAAGVYTFTLQVTDTTKATATKSVTLTATTTGLVIRTTSPLPEATVGAAYSQTISAAGGTPPYTWSLVSGAPPPGVAFEASSALLGGTPTTAGNFSFAIHVKDSAGSAVSRTFSVAVNPPSLLIFTASPLPPGVTGSAYLSSIVAVGGTPPYQWVITAGALPPGLTLALANGVLSGTPSDPGTFQFTVRVTDSLRASSSREFSLSVDPGVVIVGIVNSASLQLGAVAPGSLVSIFGSGLGPEAGASFLVDAAGQIGNVLGGTRVLFDGVPAPLLFAQARQVNAIVPFGVAGKTSVNVVVEFRGARSKAFPLPVAESAPALLTQDASGKGPGALLNEDGTLNSAANPAARASVVVLFATGAGLTDPPSADGRLSTDPLPKLLLPVSLTIGGAHAEILYAGAAPSLVAGVVQLNAKVPEGVQPGRAVPVVLMVGNASSQAGVTLAVR